jgi:hypothetical protein
VTAHRPRIGALLQEPPRFMAHIQPAKLHAAATVDLCQSLFIIALYCAIDILDPSAQIQIAAKTLRVRPCLIQAATGPASFKRLSLAETPSLYHSQAMEQLLKNTFDRLHIV